MGKYEGLPREELLRLMKERYDGVINAEKFSNESLIEKLENFDRWEASQKDKPMDN